jgi:REP element-mobilizing transposase RayT
LKERSATPLIFQLTLIFEFYIPSVMSKQTSFFKRAPLKAYGGELRKKAKNRGARPLVTKSGSIHLSLRSTKATGPYSFQASKNRKRVSDFINSFSAKKGVQILGLANVGNHIHLHIKIPNHSLYRAWIRGLTSGLAMIAMGLNGLKQLKAKKTKFWDYRPFSRVIQSWRHFKNTKSYLEINLLEGMGMPRLQAEILIKGSRHLFKSTA